MAILSLLNEDEQYSVRTGSELLQAYKTNPTLPLKFGCCDGKCGVCAIKVVKGEEHLSKPTRQEKQTLQEKGLEISPYRLACQCAIHGDVTIERPQR